MKRKKTATAELGVVAEVEQQAAQAAALAGIAGQDRLSDPRTNPAVRSHADGLRDEQQTRALDAEHTRRLRRHRVTDRRAEDAERTLEAIQLARQAANPARSVLALHTGKRVYSRLTLAASLVLAAGSALGVEATAQVLHAPRGSGLIAEVGLTGLATAAITYRAHLAEHGGSVERGSWQSRVLWALMVVPLLVSVGCNLLTLNAVGAFCAISAAAFAVLACVIADRSAAAMQSRATQVDGADEDELRTVAMGEDLFAAVQPERRTVAEVVQEDEDGVRVERSEIEAPAAGADGEAWIEAQTRGAAEGIEAWLAEQEPPQEGGAPTTAPAPLDGGPQGAAADPPATTPEGGHTVGAAETGPGGHIERAAGRTGGHIDGDRQSRVLPAIEARRAVGASTQGRVAAYYADHPDATRAEVARALEISPETVKRHRRALRGGDR
ncbi:hypothetical protein [Actinomadura xylanilytica]|uniref:hypothetical protein n=1 Tax=Actinomadura xylanilytica TaxID=887459 RepID=UPI00255AB4C3|nr:hypothetical protein [Actinomadura xylanilytica]MDL4777870.1 hypothetical protein [Actinomadura xylanilytica]